MRRVEALPTPWWWLRAAGWNVLVWGPVCLALIFVGTWC